MLDTTEAEVRLSVRDNGHGFDEARVTPRHLGLAMMRERGEDAGSRSPWRARPAPAPP